MDFNEEMEELLDSLETPLKPNQQLIESVLIRSFRRYWNMRHFDGDTDLEFLLRNAVVLKAEIVTLNWGEGDHCTSVPATFSTRPDKKIFSFELPAKEGKGLALTMFGDSMMLGFSKAVDFRQPESVILKFTGYILNERKTSVPPQETETD